MADIFKVLSKTKPLKLSMMGVFESAHISETKILGNAMAVIIKGDDKGAGVYNHREDVHKLLG